ncbi:NPCBM/NEW2 domain-containing protein [Deinococcus sp. YIM 134068]|uniref:NPCBM/NEW2 domain-containing protein n=1 Tax=Deinococcus lichenicola TaxID=3118910 RepID=UPI002F95991B
MPQRRASLFIAPTVPWLLLACSQGTSPVESDPYAGGRSYPWEAHASAQPLALAPGINTLQYETPTLARNSWGPFERNRSNGEQQPGDGRPLTLNGQTYAQGLGVHAGSELRFDLKGTNGARCNNFTADIGVDDEVGGRGSVIFQVWADGTQLYDSGVTTGAGATKRVNVGVVGRQELRLVVTDGGNGISYDHADWADPKLECATTKPEAGSLDTSWNPVPTSGPLNTALLEPDGNVLTGDIIARQPDGKRLVVTNVTGGKFEVRRYNPNGSLDTGYGQGGRVTTNFGAANGPLYGISQGGALDAVLQPDGKLIVVGGGLGPSGNSDFALARYTPNGSPDMSFGSDGLVFTDLAPLQDNPYPQPFGSVEEARQVALGPGGTIVVSGPYENMFLPRAAGAMARYRPDGSPDTSFAGSGLTRVTGDGGISFVVEPNGDMILALGGRATAYVGVNVRRLLTNGRFGGESGNFFMGELEGPNGISDLALQADGKIVLAGSTDYLDDSGSPYGPEAVGGGALVRLNSDLSLDSSFGNEGRVVIAPRRELGGSFEVRRVLLQPDGKIVTVGQTLLRFWP